MYKVRIWEFEVYGDLSEVLCKWLINENLKKKLFLALQFSHSNLNQRMHAIALDYKNH